jgi:tetratricopeptide (TPR) repeat protein
MNLAVLRKMIDDYEGARQIWEFLTLASPQQPGPFANLASLYAFDLKDPVRAKENFTKAIQKNPKDVSVYRNAYDFYRYFLKDNNQAKLMLTEGIAQTKSPDLQYLLDHYDEL